jgi:undecaprenyl diphosphate synthase
MCSKNNIRFSLIGNIAELPKDLREAFLELAEFTKDNTGMNLQVAVSYGSRDEITRTVRALAERIAKNELRVDQIDEDLISRSLDTSGQRDPDLVIRTSGEFRISNYLLWQSAYSEFYFSDVLWPEFDETCLMKAIETFNGRERRFGKTGQQLFQESQTS